MPTEDTQPPVVNVTAPVVETPVIVPAPSETAHTVVMTAEAAVVDGVTDTVEEVSEVYDTSIHARLAAVEKHLAELIHASSTDLADGEAVAISYGEHLRQLCLAGWHKVEDFFHLSSLHVAAAPKDTTTTGQ